MLVVELKKFICRHKFGVSFAELKKQFAYNDETLRFFIDKWILEGKLKKFESKACCTSRKVCGSCDALAFEFYSWVDRRG